jgi:uncharacterized membrane protein
MAENEHAHQHGPVLDLLDPALATVPGHPADADHAAAADSDAVVRRAKKKKSRCVLSGVEMPTKELFPVAMLRPSLVDRLRVLHPDLPPDARISLKELNRLRGSYVEDLLKRERGDVSVLEREVIESLERHETLAEDTEREYEGTRTLGERLADVVASFGGSWTFIISFAVFVVGWMAINLALGQSAAFDLYPFILLNLLLSCIAAVQAPVIMMSQKRQEAKDRLRSENDYAVNLKAELEIRHLHEKMDHLLKKQWERLAEIQEIQIELLQDLAHRKRGAMRKRRLRGTAVPADQPPPQPGAGGGGR